MSDTAVPKKVKKSKRIPADTADTPTDQIERTADVSALTQQGWIAGLAGSITVLVLGYLGSRLNVLEKGWGLPLDTTPYRSSVAITALIVVAAVMFVVELVVRLRVEQGRVISRPPELVEGRSSDFFFRCLKIYFADLFFFGLFWGLYYSAGEYAFKRSPTGYYQPWFMLMDVIIRVYVIGGLPYILLTRALQYDPKADRKAPSSALFKALAHLEARLGLASKNDPPPAKFDEFDRTAILGMFVKGFFVPLMTVFFADQFTNLVKNYTFALGLIADGSRKFTVRESYDCALSIIFSIDVGLAWAGYVLSSRWIKNGMISVEPTVLGWLVALLNYPPFNRTSGLYFTNPGEHSFLALTSKPAVILLASCSVASFTVYTVSTAMFGLHFSNLTHRGIVSTGPYSVVRHPAYASKNFSWWCVMFPYAIVDAVTKQSVSSFVLNTVGLITLTGTYYLRAITEERHLSKDPEYRDYMERVPYRFIPGVF